MGSKGYFGWTCDGFEVNPDEDDTIKEIVSEKYEEIDCPETGCVKGWITLLFSRIPCKTCNGSGKIKQKKTNS